MTTLNTERQQQIAQFVRQQRRATVEQLSQQFGVSEATIRRDLEKLDSAGAIRRAHGGAVAVERAAPEPPVVRRADDYADEKRRIGQAAAALIQDGETIFLGSGTTTLEVARHLEGRRNLKVITNALNIANQISGYPDITVIITGGLLRASELSMIGHLTEQALREFRADRAIMGIRALSVRDGLTNDYGLETAIDRAIVGCAPQLILVADQSKLDRVATVVIAPIGAVHTLVTSTDAPPEVVDELRAAGVAVVLA